MVTLLNFTDIDACSALEIWCSALAKAVPEKHSCLSGEIAGSLQAGFK
jgi:hypothetical protein